MAHSEMFDSSLRSAGDLAGFFEYDGEVGYFYLYEPAAPEDKRILGALQIVVGDPGFEEADVVVDWDAHEEKVGLFIRGQLWAVFDARTRKPYGGNFPSNGRADIPIEVS